MTGFLHIIYVAVLVFISLFGVFEIVMRETNNDRTERCCRFGSVFLWAGAILLFALCRQPYLTAILFLLFMVKITLLLYENR